MDHEKIFRIILLGSLGEVEESSNHSLSINNHHFIVGDRMGSIYFDRYPLIIPFDDKGPIDKKELGKAMRLGMELLPPLSYEENHKQVINATHRFAKRRYEHEFKWKPSRKVEDAIVAAVFR